VKDVVQGLPICIKKFPLLCEKGFRVFIVGNQQAQLNQALLAFGG